jgi:hypothetical protein
MQVTLYQLSVPTVLFIMSNTMLTDPGGVGLRPSFAGITVLNPARCMDVGFLWMLYVLKTEVSATGWSLTQRIPKECDVSECDL